MPSGAMPSRTSRKRSHEEVSPDPDAEVDAADRACDACRMRRVRCDKVTPCGNCKKRGDVCQKTVGVNPEPRTRVIITKEYEKKFDFMVDRLVNIERLLQQQQARTTHATSDWTSEYHQSTELNVSSVDTTNALPSPASQPSAAADIDTCDATTGAHTTAARKVVEQAVEGSPGTYQDFELLAALNSLKDMAGRIEDGPNSLDHSESAWRPLHSGSDILTPPSSDELRRLIEESEGKT